MRATIIFLATLIASGQATLSQIPEYIEIQVSKNASGQFDFSKFDFLKSELAKADIVLLGEPSHSPQYYEIKIQLVKYLHEQLDFDVLAFESGLYQLETANSEIKNGGNIYEAFENSVFPLWTSKDEFQQLYEYLDILRAANDMIQITGFDCQVSASYASKRFVSDFESALINQNITPNKKALRILQSQFVNLETGKKGLTEDFNDNSIRVLSDVAQSIRSINELSVYYQSLLGWIGHFSDLYYNKLFEKLTSGNFQGPDSNTRDSLMAENMLFLYQKLYQGKKIIGWGANVHFGNKVMNLQTWDSTSRDFRGMGYHLKQKLGDKVFFLAVTTDNNYPYTFENELSKKNVDLAWVTRSKITNRDFSSCLLEKPTSGDWSEVVDGILYFNSSENIPLNEDNNFFIKGKVLNASVKESVSFASISIDGTTFGTASDIDGEYIMKIDSSNLNKTAKIHALVSRLNIFQ